MGFPAITEPTHRWLAPALALGLAATALSLARFGYSILLPAMQTDLGWSYAQAGGLNTANALGYLCGALLSATCVRCLGAMITLRWAAAVTAASLIACAFTADYVALGMLRAIGGMSAGILFVAAGLLAARLADASARPGAVLGVYYAGVGPGILLSALLAPAILDDPARWRLGWWVLGLLTAACGAIAVRSTRRVAAITGRRFSSRRGTPSLRWAMVAFGAFGLGYIPFMTFAVAYWQDSGAGTGSISLLWSALAISATACGWTFRRLLERPHRALVVMLGVVTAGAALPLLSTSMSILFASSVLFGAGFLGVSIAVTELVRGARSPHEWRQILAVLTTLFAAGQVAGPLLAGWLADVVGLRGGLAAAVVLLGLAAAAAGMQQRSHVTAVPADPGPIGSVRRERW